MANGQSSNPLAGADTKSVSSIWKMSNSPPKPQHQSNLRKNLTNNTQFSSIDNLTEDQTYKQRTNNYAQLGMTYCLNGNVYLITSPEKSYLHFME